MVNFVSSFIKYDEIIFWTLFLHVNYIDSLLLLIQFAIDIALVAVFRCWVLGFWPHYFSIGAWVGVTTRGLHGRFQIPSLVCSEDLHVFTRHYFPEIIHLNAGRILPMNGPMIKIWYPNRVLACESFIVFEFVVLLPALFSEINLNYRKTMMD